MYLERLRTRALKSLEGFLMYAHYGRVGAIPSHSASTLHICFAHLRIFKLRVGKKRTLLKNCMWCQIIPKMQKCHSCSG